VGYKKHSLRLWLGAYRPSVVLIPLITWVAPASVPDGYLLKPSIEQCIGRFHWRPDIVTGDLGYIHQQTKKVIRETWQVAVITKMKAGMNMVAPFEAWNRAACPQGQPLQWIGYFEDDHRHWFRVNDPQPICNTCWDQALCDRQFNHDPAEHETLLGLLPLNTLSAQRILNQVRSWIEPCQSFEKNLLGLNNQFLNSLRITWYASLVADAVVLLRSLALLTEPDNWTVFDQSYPRQMHLDFDEKT
jgi:hypothetical protein